MLRFARTLLMGLLAAAASALVPLAQADSPAEELLKLVPPDAGATLLVENFRDRYREIKASPLFEAALRLPVVQAWLQSKPLRHLAQTGRDVETALGLPGAIVRDEMIGDALILTLRPGPPQAPDQARGLLLLRPRDRALLDRLINEINKTQLKNGELVSIEARRFKNHLYGVRTFKPGEKPTEYFTFLPDEVFAWTNSEELLTGVIACKIGGAPGLWQNPSFQKVRKGLPAQPLLSLFLNPRLLDREIKAPPSPLNTNHDRLISLAKAYVAALDYAGFALQIGDGVYLHSQEVLATDRFEPWLKRWLIGPSRATKLMTQLPESALIVVSANVHLDALRQAFDHLITGEARSSLQSYQQLAQGLLLGLDPLTQVVPRLGPETLAYLEIAPGIPAIPRYPFVTVLPWTEQPGGVDLSPAIDNAMRTALVIYALGPLRASSHLQVQSRTIGEVKVTELTDGLRTQLAYRVDRNRLILSNSVEAVARFGAVQPLSNLARIRSQLFPLAETFAIVDLTRLAVEVRSIRVPLTRRLAARSQRTVEEVDRDIGHILALSDLFQSVWVTSVTAPDGSAIHRTIGWSAR